MIKYNATKLCVIREPTLDYHRMEESLYNKTLLMDLAAKPEVQEALFYASIELYDEFQKFVSNKLPTKENDRMINTLVKYITRMATRATPFASFASCSVGKIGDLSDMSKVGSQKLHFRYDLEFLHKAVTYFIIADESVFPQLSYRKNPTLIRIGNKYRYLEYTPTSSSFQICEIKTTPIMNSVLRLLSTFTSYQQLREAITAEFDISDDMLISYIIQLSRAQIILTTLSPNVIGHDYLERIVEVSNLCDSTTASFFNNLADIVTKLNNSGSFKERKSLIERLFSLIDDSGLKVNKKHVFQVDSYETGKKEISDKLIPQLISAFNMLNRVTPRFTNRRLNNFISKFQHRYEMEWVPLLRALDPDIGIGYEGSPSIVAQPLIYELKAPKRETPGTDNVFLTRFQQLLKHKVLADISAHEITIDDSDISDFESPATSDLPLSMSAMFRIGVTNHGIPTPVCPRFAGSSGANLLARFSDGLVDIAGLVKEVAAKEQQLSGDVLLCEISHLPTPHIGNVLLRCSMREASIDYMAPTTGDKFDIPLSDIDIAVRQGRVCLRSKSLRRQIEARLTSAHNYENLTTGIYRFLCDLQLQGCRGALAMDWGGLRNIFNHLPRVCYNGIILSLEEWRISVDKFKEGGRYSINQFREICRSHAMPRKIVLVQSDNTLYIDSESEISVNAFFSAIKDSKTLRFREFYLPDEDLSSQTKITLINECILPFIRQTS